MDNNLIDRPPTFPLLSPFLNPLIERENEYDNIVETPTGFGQGFIQTLVSGGIKLSGGRSSGRMPRVEARSAEWGRGLGTGCPPPSMGGGVLTPGTF